MGLANESGDGKTRICYVKVLITHSATSKSPALKIFTEVKL